MMTRLAVPAYFLGRSDLARLLDARPRHVVLNPDSGPGSRRLDRYVEVDRELAGCGAAILWYVHLSYGCRGIVQVQEELERYAAWYPFHGVLFDEVPADLRGDPGRHVAKCARIARDCGASTVAINPGTSPVLGQVDGIDIVATFEGTCDDYLAPAAAATLSPRARWRTGHPPNGWQEWHLVHSASTRMHSHVLQVAQARGADLAYVTEGAMPNPWASLSSSCGAGRTGLGERPVAATLRSSSSRGA